MELEGPDSGALDALVLKASAADALRLPKGDLILESWATILVGPPPPEMVIGAAKVILQHKDKTEFYSQAGVVAHASQKYGFKKEAGKYRVDGA